MIENRKKRRYELRLPVELVRAGRVQVHNQGETRNVSTGGVLFTSDARVNIGQPIEYLIRLPAAPNSEVRVRLRCLGTVLRLERSPDNKYENGPGSIRVAATMERYEFIRSKP